MAIGFLVIFIISIVENEAEYEPLVYFVLYSLYYMAYGVSARMQPYKIERAHLPVLSSYSMAVPATPQYRAQASPLATSYSPPAYLYQQQPSYQPRSQQIYTAPSAPKS